MASSSQARSRSPNAANAIAAQIAAVRVLTAVLPHARHVAADVAGIQARLVEGRIEKLDRARASRRTRRSSTAFIAMRERSGVARPGQHGPALRDRIDPAFRVAGRTERRAVVEVGAAVPLAIPAVLLDVLAQPTALRRAKLGEGRVAVHTRHLGELPEHFAQEEAQPDALALAADPHQVHAVVPVAGTDQRQTMLAEPQSVPDGAHAVLVQAGRSRRSGRADRSRSRPRG